jgi:hypothetical protein
MKFSWLLTVCGYDFDHVRCFYNVYDGKDVTGSEMDCLSKIARHFSFATDLESQDYFCLGNISGAHPLFCMLGVADFHAAIIPQRPLNQSKTYGKCFLAIFFKQNYFMSY